MKNICIIGSGASGLTCIKECLDVGFNVTCFEQCNYIGGLWRFHDEDLDDVASVTKATIINSSKELSAFSDFPPPPHLPNYCHHSQLIKYFDSYAEHFDLKKHIKFRHRVLTVKQTEDAKWLVKVLNLNSNAESDFIFDGVMVATGHHTKPHKPHFEGLDQFKGMVIHTHSYKRPDAFADKKVLVIGIGNSAGDAAVELSSVAEEVFLSTRRGAWVLSRVYKNGYPMDYLLSRRFIQYFTFKILPFNLSCSILELDLNHKFNHEMYGLKPNHRVLEQHPFVNDALPNRILSGTVKIKKNIQKFTTNGVIFEGEDGKITPLDVVILATGYETHFPFIQKYVLDTSDRHINLFKYAISPNISKPESFMFIGLVQPFGPLIPISELQARWFCQLQLGNVKLPSKEQMYLDIESKKIAHHKRYYASPRHTMQVDFNQFMDEVADQFGAKPNLFKCFFTDPVLWLHLVFGPCVPYQFRLKGPNKWKGARDAILSVSERTSQALSYQVDPKMTRGSKNYLKTFSIIAIVTIVFLFTLFV